MCQSSLGEECSEEEVENPVLGGVFAEESPATQDKEANTEEGVGVAGGARTHAFQNHAPVASAQQRATGRVGRGKQARSASGGQKQAAGGNGRGIGRNRDGYCG